MADYNGDLKLVAYQIGELTKKIDDIDEKIDPVCDMVIRHDENIKTNEREIETLRKNSNIKDWVIGIGAAIGTAVSIGIGANK